MKLLSVEHFNLKLPANLNLRKVRYISLSLFSGILMGLATEPLGWWLVAWVAFVPLWVMVVEAKRRGRIPWEITAGWGVGYYGFSLFWMTGIHPMTSLGVPWLASLAIAIFSWVFITLWGTAIVIVWGWLFAKLMPLNIGAKTSLIRILIGTALWCALEAVWSGGPLWWSTLALTQSFGNLVILHLGQISGPNTVVATILVVNGTVAELWLTHKQQKSSLYLIPVGIFAIAHLIGFSLYNIPLNSDPETSLRVGVIQGNIPNEIKLNPQGFRQALNGYTRGYLELAARGVDAVLTPETALPFVWNRHDSYHYNYSLYQAILPQGVIAWVGGFGETEGGLTNSLFTINGEGEIIGQYDKTHLVPLGEYIPFDAILGRVINRLSPLEARLVAGEKQQKFETGWGKAIAGICYDSAFADHFRRQVAAGGEFILTASNDAHYATMMLSQHHAQDVMRAIEGDRWTVRATNTGYSGIIDPHGRTLWISGINTYEIHDHIIYRRHSQTLYVRWGDWLTFLLLAISAIVIFWNRFLPLAIPQNRR